MTVPFVHLRLHSEYSLVDGLVKLKPLVSTTAERGMPALALTGALLFGSALTVAYTLRFLWGTFATKSAGEDDSPADGHVGQRHERLGVRVVEGHLKQVLGVSGDHHDLGACGVQGVDGVAGLSADLVGQAKGADDPAVGEDVEDDRALLAPGMGDGQLRQIVVLEQVGATDLDHRAVDARPHPHCRG